MSGEFFGRLLYTDCKPGAGRGAGGGFQVQAQSPGVDSAQSQLAVSGLLYEVQLPWLTQRRPVEDFPLGFAHVSGQGYGTAQGRYVGKAALGGRDGNHLADCLLTRDPDLYGPVRPAQLWRSDFWRAEPWDSKDCPRFDAADLAPGPLTVEAVADWARSAPERGPVLARLLSLLEDPAGRRAVILAANADEAMTWITAATLLLPSRHALEVSFKVYSAAPLDARHRVVAAPSELFPRIAPGRGGQRFVLDARTNRCDEVATSERAAFFTGRFTDEGEDPYDVVDAVELADMLGGGRDAMLTAWALTKPDDPRPEPEALFRWMSGAEPELLGEHGAAVAAMIIEDSPVAAKLRWLDTAVADKRLDFDPAAVRAVLLIAELAEIRDGRRVPVAEVLPSVPLDVSAHWDAESELSSALLLSGNQQADVLLCLARRHGIKPELAPPLQQRLRDFVGGWIDRPGGYHPDGWALRAEILDYAHNELRHRVNTDGVEAATTAIRRLNRYFGDRASMSELVDWHIQASLLADQHQPGRVRRLRQLLADIAGLAQSPTMAKIAVTAAAGLQRALLDWNAVDGDVAVTILTDMPGSLAIEPVIADRAAEQLERMSQKPSRGLLELLASLEKRGKAPAAGPLAKVLAADEFVREFTRRALDDGLPTNFKYFDDTVGILLDADAAVIQARADEVLAALINSPSPHLAPIVLRSLKTALARALVARWADTLGTRDLVGDGIWCVRCLDNDQLPRKVEEQLLDAIRGYARLLPAQDFEKWYGDVKRKLPPELRAVWDSIFTQQEERPRSWMWTNRDGGR
jgi:hypothetical protein